MEGGAIDVMATGTCQATTGSFAQFFVDSCCTKMACGLGDFPQTETQHHSGQSNAPGNPMRFRKHYGQKVVSSETGESATVTWDVINVVRVILSVRKLAKKGTQRDTRTQWRKTSRKEERDNRTGQPVVNRFGSVLSRIGFLILESARHGGRHRQLHDRSPRERRGRMS